MDSPFQNRGLCHLAGESWGGNKSVRPGLHLSNLSRCCVPGPPSRACIQPAPPFNWDPEKSLKLADLERGEGSQATELRKTSSGSVA